MGTRDLLPKRSNLCRPLWDQWDPVVFQGHLGLRVRKDSKDCVVNRERAAHRAHQDHKEKEGFLAFQEKTEIREKTGVQDLRGLRARLVPEGCRECLVYLVPKATGAFRAWTAPKASKVSKAKRDRWELQERQDQQGLRVRPGLEENEGAMDLRDHREYEASMVCRGPQGRRVRSAAQALQDFRGLQE